MKPTSIISAVLLCFSLSASAKAGNEGVGGGSGCMAEVMQTVSQVGVFLESAPKIPAADKNSFMKTATAELFVLVEESDGLKYKGNTVDAFFDGNVVLLSCTRFLKNSSKARMLLIAHEVFRKMGIEGDGYEITRNWDIDSMNSSATPDEKKNYGPLYSNDSRTLEVTWSSNSKISASLYTDQGTRIDYSINNDTQTVISYHADGSKQKQRGYLQLQAVDRVVFYLEGKISTFKSGEPLQCMKSSGREICVNDLFVNHLGAVWLSQPIRIVKLLKSSDSTHIVFTPNQVWLHDDGREMLRVTTNGCLRGACIDASTNKYFIDMTYGDSPKFSLATLVGFVDNGFLVQGYLPSSYFYTVRAEHLYSNEENFVSEISTGNKCIEVSEAEAGRIDLKLRNAVTKKCSAKKDHCSNPYGGKTETPGGHCIFSSTAVGYKRVTN